MPPRKNNRGSSHSRKKSQNQRQQQEQQQQQEQHPEQEQHQEQEQEVQEQDQDKNVSSQIRVPHQIVETSKSDTSSPQSSSVSEVNYPLNDNKTSNQRMSVLYNTNDELKREEKTTDPSHAPRKMSIADTISSIAQESAAFTEGSILRRDSLAVPDQNPEPQASTTNASVPQAPTTNAVPQDATTNASVPQDATTNESSVPQTNSADSKTEDNQDHGHQHGTQEANKPASHDDASISHHDVKKAELIEQNTFENAIKDNKLEFSDEGQSTLKPEEKHAPELSPMTVADDISDSNQEQQSSHHTGDDHEPPSIGSVLDIGKNEKEHQKKLNEIADEQSSERRQPSSHQLEVDQQSTVPSNNADHSSSLLEQIKHEKEQAEQLDSSSNRQESTQQHLSQQGDMDQIQDEKETPEPETEFPWNQGSVSNEEQFPFENVQVPHMSEEHFNSLPDTEKEIHREDLPWYNQDPKQPLASGANTNVNNDQQPQSEQPSDKFSHERNHEHDADDIPKEGDTVDPKMKWQENQSDQHKMPWEEESHQDEQKLPWEEDDHQSEQKLPWEEESHKDDKKLPWEEDQESHDEKESREPESHNEKQKLPWEEEEHYDEQQTLPWEKEGEDRTGQQKLPWEVREHHDEQQKLPWEKDQQVDREKLTWEEQQAERDHSQDNQAQENHDSLPWDQKVQSQGQQQQDEIQSQENVEKNKKIDPSLAEFHHEPQDQNEDLESREAKLEALFGDDDEEFFSKAELKNDSIHNSRDASNSDPITGNSHSESTGIANDKKLDDLFAEDDNELVRKGSTSIGTQSNLNLDHNESNPKDQPSSSLDFLELDDDLLLDEKEFVKSVTSSVSTNRNAASNQKKAAHHSYTPTQPASSNHYAAPPKAIEKKDFTQNLEQAKKKNDAYDFPDGLISQKIKPAARHSNKYAPSASSSTHSLPPTGLHHTGQSSGSVLPPPSMRPSNNSRSSSVSSSHLSSAPVQSAPKPKAFFEELPVSMPKPGARPARAAAPVRTPSSVTSSSPGLVKPQLSAGKVKSPVNPYAKLAPPPQKAPTHAYGPVPPPNQTMGNGLPPSAAFPPPSAAFPPPSAAFPPPSAAFPPPSAAFPPPSAAFSPSSTTFPPSSGQITAPHVGPTVYGQPPSVQSSFGHPHVGQPLVDPHAGPQQYGSQAGQHNHAPQAPAQLPYGQPLPPLGQANSSIPAQNGSSYSFPNGASSQGSSHAQSFPTLQTSNQASKKTSPGLINTNVAKSQDKGSATSPYVPNAGPYAPSSHRRTHSRASSLIGGKGKEVNPYAPVNQDLLPTPIAPQGSIPPPMQGSVLGKAPAKPFSPKAPPAAMHSGPTVPGVYSNRTRGTSNPRSGIYAAHNQPQPAPKIQDPNALLHRQFPIFSWSNSQSIAYLIPNKITNAYDHSVGSIQVKAVSETLPNKNFYSTFPGPLGKTKSKKKEVEKWLETNIEVLRNKADSSGSDELILNEILLALLIHNGDCKAPDFIKAACSAINPSVDYSQQVDTNFGHSLNVAANAYKLDNSGINTVWSYLQAGHPEEAVDFAVSRGDWALSLIISNFISAEKFGKVASDYSRQLFPYQKTPNKVAHLMPILLKVLSGNPKGVVEDFMKVPAEGDWATAHYREIIAAVLINGSVKAQEFLSEFGGFQASMGRTNISEVCYILASLPMSHTPVGGGRAFSVVGSQTLTSIYSEIYEFALQLSPVSNIPPTGIPHLIVLKLKHAQLLADYGLFSESQKYCDHIGATIKSAGRSNFFSPTALHELQNLLMRISESNSNEGSWLSGTISRVNLDKMWGHLDKFIGGEEPKQKATESGVFNRFSPSISRTASTLDLTVMPQTSPQAIKDHRDTYSSMNSTSAPTTSSDAMKPAYVPLPNRPGLASNNSSTTASKYSPGPTASGYTKPTHLALQREQQQHSSPLVPQTSTPPVNLPPGTPSSSKYLPSNGSTHSLQLNDGAADSLLPPKKAQSKYSPLTQKATIGSSRNYPYSNRGAQSSTSSIASHISINNAPNTTSHTAAHHNTQKRPSVGSVNSTEVGHEQLNHHQGSPSMQSDLSMDYPSDFKSTPKRFGGGIQDMLADEFEKKGESEYIPETINESPEFEGSQFSNSKHTLPELTLSEDPYDSRSSGATNKHPGFGTEITDQSQAAPQAVPPPPQALPPPPQAAPPQAAPPQAVPPQAVPPQAVPPPPQALPPPPQAAPPQAAPPQAVPPQAVPPQAAPQAVPPPPQAVPPQAAPQAVPPPPQAAPPQAAPPQAAPPQAAPPQAAPPQAAPPQAAPPQAAPPQAAPHEPSQQKPSQQEPSRVSQQEQSQATSQIDNKEVPQAPLVAPPPPKGNNTRSTRAKANPYAPDSSSKPARSNRYGPSSRGTSKYSVPEGSTVNEELYTGLTENVQYGDLFGHKTQNGETSTVNDGEMNEHQGSSEAPNIGNKSETGISTQEIPHAPPPSTSLGQPASQFSNHPPPTNFASSSRFEPPSSFKSQTNRNVDESFDEDRVESSHFNPVSEEHSGVRSSLLLNTFNSPGQQNRDSSFNPYQSDSKSPSFGLNQGFGDFPIPGSPELTTRANSVIGGPGGLYSSRLSQSQQSALYQQYEIQDDTVRDYVPVPEDDEDEEDDAAAKAERVKREEEARKARLQADKSRQQATKAAKERAQASNGSGSWFGWLGKNKDEKKPIRAKLGEKNKFEYNEKLGRYIDTTRPIEEQMVAAAPPPPPKRKAPTSSSVAGPPASSGPPVPSGPPGPPGPPTPLGRLPASLNTSEKPSGDAQGPTLSSGHPPARSGPPAGAKLGGLDDLLSLGNGSSSTVGTARKGKRGGRRGYVNVLEQS